MTISYTICSANYLAYAKSLGDSLVEHNSHHKFIIVIVDRYPELDASFFLPHSIICIDEMGINEFAEMSRQYNIFELSCAVKPFAASYIFESFSACEQVLYFDSDIHIFHSLKTAEEHLNHSSVIITPHFCKPINTRVRSYIERTVLRSGIYNGGFFGLKRCEETAQFLTWWKKRLEIFCYNDTKNGLFVDQLWLNLAPLLFKNVNVFYNEGYNTAYWNLDERSFSSNENNLIVNQKYPLVFFHFSGYSFENKNTISNFFTDYKLVDNPLLMPLFEKYKTSVIANKHTTYSTLIPFFGKKDDKKIVNKYNKFFGLKKRDLKKEDYKIQ